MTKQPPDTMKVGPLFLGQGMFPAFLHTDHIVSLVRTSRIESKLQLSIDFSALPSKQERCIDSTVRSSVGSFATRAESRQTDCQADCN
jgi:hypothetical protein